MGSKERGASCNIGETMRKLLILLVFLLALPASSFAATAPTTSATPDPSTNPVLANIQKMGAKFFYLGNRLGLNGWFIVKDGQVQIAYATTDNKGALIGGLFGENGENITAQQVSALIQNNKEVADLIMAAQKEQAAIAQTGSPAPTATPPASGILPSTPLSPGERLIHDLSGASTVIVGQPSTPEILMVMDPRCPHCQATWNAFRNVVMKGSLHIRMIPIAAPGSDNERAAAMLLGVADPLNAWDKYVAGDKTQLDGTPPAAALAAVRANHAIIDNWSIQNTPYLVYRAKDGKVKVLQGEPDKLSAVLGDLGI